MRRTICMLCLMLCLMQWNIVANAEQTMKVAFINPSTPDNPFWGNVTTFMQAVAHDLDIELQVVYAEKSWLKTRSLALEILESEEKPDYLLTLIQRGAIYDILEAAEQANVSTFIFNSAMAEKERETCGLPREKFSNWIGHMFPDDRQGGQQLTEALIADATQKGLYGADEKISLVAISGSSNSSAAFQRNSGLEQTLQAHPEVSMQQLIFTDWGREEAQEKTELLLKRYPDTSVIWTASDHMALGVADAIRKLGKQPGKDVLTGGFDWLPDVIEAIRDGSFTATVGGHFMEGGWTLILAYDYHHGIDFADELGTTIQSSMQVIHAGNAQEYLDKLAGENDWEQFDFTRFSKTRNPDLKKYDFGLDALLNQ